MMKRDSIQDNDNPVHKFCDRDIDSFKQNSVPLKKSGIVYRNVKYGIVSVQYTE